MWIFSYSPKLGTQEFRENMSRALACDPQSIVCDEPVSALNRIRFAPVPPGCPE